MEAENHNHSHFLNLFKENPSQAGNLNSMYLQNPRDDDHDHHHDVFHGHYHHQQQANVVIKDQEKRLRRMVSNRESARRSRIRRKKQIEDFQMQIGQLRASKQYLNEKVFSLLETNQELFQENAQLKVKVSSLLEKNHENLQEIAQLKEQLSNFHQIFMDKTMIIPGTYTNGNGF